MDATVDIRASDTEREAAAARLRQHTVEGRLTVEEFLERLDEAFAAKTRGDLEVALRELPPLPPAPPARAVAPRAPVWPLFPLLPIAAIVLVFWTLSAGWWPLWPLLWWSGWLLLAARSARWRGATRVRAPRWRPVTGR